MDSQQPTSTSTATTKDPPSPSSDPAMAISLVDTAFFHGTAPDDYKNHAEGFIFTLTNPHNIPPTKYSRNLNRTNMQSTATPDMVQPLVMDMDIYVADNSHQNTHSNTNFTGGYGYIDTTGKGMNTFTGAKNFTTNEIEVFAVL